MYLGIDVAKAELVIAGRPAVEPWTVPNTPDGLQQLVEHVTALAPRVIVLEATGGTSARVPPPWPRRSSRWWS